MSIQVGFDACKKKMNKQTSLKKESLKMVIGSTNKQTIGTKSITYQS